jgi:hypothetical protein
MLLALFTLLKNSDLPSSLVNLVLGGTSHAARGLWWYPHAEAPEAVQVPFNSPDAFLQGRCDTGFLDYTLLHSYFPEILGRAPLCLEMSRLVVTRLHS